MQDKLPAAEQMNRIRLQARERGQKRNQVFKKCFDELEKLLPSDKNCKRKTNKQILLETAAYIRALEVELGILSDEQVNWEHHVQMVLKTFFKE